jgi:hypothetical protein
MIDLIFTGFGEIFGYGIMLSLLLLFSVLGFIFFRNLGILAGTVGFLLMAYMAWYYPIIQVPIISTGLVVGIFIIFGLFVGFLVYELINR